MTHTATPPPTNGQPGPVAAAVHHLQAAATAAETNTGGHPFSPWAALASQIRLTADTIDPTSPTQPPHPTPDSRPNSTPAERPDPRPVESNLRRAAEALDQTPPSADALQWIWQVHQLRRLTAQLTAQLRARLADQPSAPS